MHLWDMKFAIAIGGESDDKEWWCPVGAKARVWRTAVPELAAKSKPDKPQDPNSLTLYRNGEPSPNLKYTKP